MLKIMLVAAPLLGGGLWLAGGVNALTGAAAADAKRQAVCNEIVDRAIDDHRNSFSGPRLASAETAALESEAWSQAVQAEIKEAGCDEGRAAVRFIKGGGAHGGGIRRSPLRRPPRRRRPGHRPRTAGYGVGGTRLSRGNW